MDLRVRISTSTEETANFLHVTDLDCILQRERWHVWHDYRLAGRRRWAAPTCRSVATGSALRAVATIRPRSTECSFALGAAGREPAFCGAVLAEFLRVARRFDWSLHSSTRPYDGINGFDSARDRHRLVIGRAARRVEAERGREDQGLRDARSRQPALV